MGIDIGTTSISIVLIDKNSGELLGKRTINNDSFVNEDTPESKTQDPEKIWQLTREGIEELVEEYGIPCCIGMTGQMHGMLYVDKNGNAVSSLYTWQDGNGTSVAHILQEQVGIAASGYGLTTHFYLQRMSLIPNTAVKMTNISDYIAMKLCGNTKPKIGIDMAASWGCFDLEKKEFSLDKLKSAGVDVSYLPELLPEHAVIGKTIDGIPIISSLGDNQASVLGSVKHLKETVLINIGTGSQVSVLTDKFSVCDGSIELRPCSSNDYLIVGAGLCGGRVYAMLEKFYREVSRTEEDCYNNMYQQALKFLNGQGKENAWQVKTTFSGTRSNPSDAGSISGIRVDNFTPGAFTVGMMQGILSELYDAYEVMCEKTGKRATQLVGSGNGIRKNPLLRQLAEEMFGMKMKIPSWQEEAACGAALYGAVTAGILSAEKVKEFIVYESEL